MGSQPYNIISVCYRTELEPGKEGKVEQLAVVKTDVVDTCQNSKHEGPLILKVDFRKMHALHLNHQMTMMMMTTVSGFEILIIVKE